MRLWSEPNRSSQTGRHVCRPVSFSGSRNRMFLRPFLNFSGREPDDFKCGEYLSFVQSGIRFRVLRGEEGRGSARRQSAVATTRGTGRGCGERRTCRTKGNDRDPTWNVVNFDQPSPRLRRARKLRGTTGEGNGLAIAAGGPGRDRHGHKGRGGLTDAG